MNRGIPACDWILSADTYTQTWLHDCQRSAACLWVRGEAELWSAPQVVFERTFGAPVEQLAELVAKKEVTLPKLLELGVSSTAAMIASDIDPVPRWGV